jgi:dTDP-L-rhamnose 4-epimerase
VRDVAAANVAALGWTGGAASASSVVGLVDALAGTFRAFNVGSGTPRTVGDLAAGLATATGGPRPVHTGQYRLGDVRHVTASSRRLREELGWAPAVGFGEGLREFAAC